MCLTPGFYPSHSELAIALDDARFRIGLVADACQRSGDGIVLSRVVAVGDAARPDFATEVVDTGKDVFSLCVYYRIVSCHVD